jgi:3'-phosphoadenosine 5'-phosphosulfate sulfotransferase (PAPS reductase)/FAD synthetase
MSRVLCWFSCGAASAVATRMTLRGTPEAVPVYCETGAEHPDNERFMSDCVRWFNAPVTRIRSDEFRDTWHVWEKTRWLAGIEGARCTGELKVAPRLAFQSPHDVHVFGYTADGPDVKRAERLRANFPELQIRTPLIGAGLTKSAVLAIIERAGIELPVMYRLGFHNNNCIPCVKATSANYWSLVRKEFPDQFERMSKLSRDLGVRLARVKDERVFIDDIPEDWPTTDPIQPACDFLCAIEESKEAAE